jgi:hypothetical protein
LSECRIRSDGGAEQNSLRSPGHAAIRSGASEEASDRRKGLHVSDDLTQLLTRVNSQNDAGAPTHPTSIGGCVAKRDAQLDVAELVACFDQ